MKRMASSARVEGRIRAEKVRGEEPGGTGSELVGPGGGAGAGRRAPPRPQGRSSTVGSQTPARLPQPPGISWGFLRRKHRTPTGGSPERPTNRHEKVGHRIRAAFPRTPTWEQVDRKAFQRTERLGKSFRSRPQLEAL